MTAPSAPFVASTNGTLVVASVPCVLYKLRVRVPMLLPNDTWLHLHNVGARPSRKTMLRSWPMRGAMDLFWCCGDSPLICHTGAMLTLSTSHIRERTLRDVTFYVWPEVIQHDSH
jgi:hypothetical protein